MDGLSHIHGLLNRGYGVDRHSLCLLGLRLLRRSRCFRLGRCLRFGGRFGIRLILYLYRIGLRFRRHTLTGRAFLCTLCVSSVQDRRAGCDHHSRCHCQDNSRILFHVGHLRLIFRVLSETQPQRGAQGSFRECSFILVQYQMLSVYHPGRRCATSGGPSYSASCSASYSPSCSASYSAYYPASCFSPYFAVRCQIKKNTAPSAHIPAPQNIAAGRAAWAAAPNSRLVAIPVPSDKTA